jgi:hypothetical protein
MRTSSLDMREDKNKDEQDSRLLKHEMEGTNKAIQMLTMELTELQKLVGYEQYQQQIIVDFLGHRISRTKISN